MPGGGNFLPMPAPAPTARGPARLAHALQAGCTPIGGRGIDASVSPGREDSTHQIEIMGLVDIDRSQSKR